MLDFWPAILAAIMSANTPQVNCNDVVTSESQCFLEQTKIYENEHKQECCAIWIEQQQSASLPAKPEIQTRITVGGMTQTQISLHVGWNFETVPDASRYIFSNSVGDGRRELFDARRYEVIYVFRNNKWLKDPTFIEAGEGFWIKMAQSQTINFSDIVRYDPIFDNLPTGWHLLGAGHTLDDVTSHRSVTMSFVHRTDGHYGANPHWVQNPSSLSIGEAFWVKINDGTGSSSSSTPSISPPTAPTIAEVMGDIQTINAISNTPITQLSRNAATAYDLSYPFVEINASNLYYIDADYQEFTDKIDKPMFIDGEYKGVIEKIDFAPSGDLAVTLKNARYITDVYKKFNIDLSVDQLESTLQRSIPKRLKGKYDSVNTNPLQFSIHQKQTTNTRGISKPELVLRIDIPEGYKIPLNTRDANVSIDCEFLEGACAFEANANYDEDQSLATVKDFSGIRFNSAGSFIEYGIGSRLFVSYDYEIFNDSIFKTGFEASGYYNTELKMNIEGKLGINDGFVFQLMQPTDITVASAYGVALQVSFVPTITVQLTGTFVGSFEAQANSARSGNISFTYESSNAKPIISDSLAYNNDVPDYAAMRLDINADATLSVFPNIQVGPKVEFFKINEKLSIGHIRGGYDVITEFNGKIGAGFTAQPDGIDGEASAQARLDMRYCPKADIKFDLAVGGTTYYDSGYQSLTGNCIDANGNAIRIFSWNVAILDTPEIIQTPSGKTDKTVTFDILGNADIDFMKFYYTTDDKRVPILKPESVATLWDRNPILLSADTTVRVRAFLHEKDIEPSQFGISVSLENATDIVMPEVDPDPDPEDIPDVSDAKCFGSTPCFLHDLEVSDNSKDYCNDIGARLPTKNEWIAVETRLFAENNINDSRFACEFYVYGNSYSHAFKGCIQLSEAAYDSCTEAFLRTSCTMCVIDR